MKLQLAVLPPDWQSEVIRLRRECATRRHERNEARQALAALADRVADALRARADVNV
jgi:hypothetical protein